MTYKKVWIFVTKIPLKARRNKVPKASGQDKNFHYNMKFTMETPTIMYGKMKIKQAI